MSLLGKELARLVHDLRSAEADFAVVGGIARVFYAGPRTTYDLDIAVAVRNDDEAERLLGALRGRHGYVLGETLEQERTGRLMTQRAVTPGGVTIDLLFASSGIEPEIARAAVRCEVLQGVHAPVATLGHLLALKVLANREKDNLDARDLLLLANAVDLRIAAESLDLIERRGFHRGLDLVRLFGQLRDKPG